MSRCAKLAVFLAFVFGCDVASSQSLRPFVATITEDLNPNITCDSFLSCVEDRCDQGRWCIQQGDKLVQFALITCDQNSVDRYCNNGVCSQEPMPRCDTSEFNCPNVDGVYPDPANCSRYHICINGVRRTNNCPANNVYDHQTGGCKYRRVSSDCVQFRCGNQDGQPIVYPRDDRIYGRCFSGKAYISGRCLDHERYNLVSQKCERHCRSTGTQPPDPGRCGKFVLCAEVSFRRYQPVEMSCGCNQAYDETRKLCAPDVPCVGDTPEIWCEEGKNPISDSNSKTAESDNNGNTDDTDVTRNNQETTEALSTTILNSGRANNGIAGWSRSVQRRGLFPFGIGRDADQPSNNDVDSALATLNDNSGDNYNDAAPNGDDDVGGNLPSADNNGDGNDTGYLEVKRRDGFLRIIDWILRMIRRQPM